MKKLFFLLTIVSFLIVSCEKESETSNSNLRNNADNNQDKPEQVKKYKLENCAASVDGVEYSGYKCVGSIYGYCLEGSSCAPIEYPGGWLELEDPKIIPNEWNLDEDEKERFTLGENIIEYNADCISEHYQMMLDFYEMGITVHPDELLSQL